MKLIKLSSPQNTLVIDTPRVRKQTRQYSSLRGEGGDLSDLDSDDEYPPANSRQSRASRRSDRHSGGGYGRTDCFRVEKHLLVYGSVDFMYNFYVPYKLFKDFLYHSSVSSHVLTQFLVGVVGETSCLTPDVSAASVNVTWRQFVVSSWSFVCFTTVEMRTSRVLSGSSSHHQRTGVNPKHYSTTLVRSCTQRRHFSN